MKNQKLGPMAALLLTRISFASCSHEPAPSIPYPNDGVLPPHQQEAVGKMPRVVVMTYQGKVDLLFQPDASCKIVAPKVNRTETFHIVLEASDKAVPKLCTYRRFIITVEP